MRLMHLVWPLWADVMACFAVTSFLLSLVMAVALVAPTDMEREPLTEPVVAPEPIDVPQPSAKPDPIEELPPEPPEPEPTPEPAPVAVVEPEPAPEPFSGTFSSHPLDLVFVVDSTTSMEPCFELLRGTVLMSAAMCARGCHPKTFRLAIVRLRSERWTKFKPLTRIGPFDRMARGGSMLQLHAWLEEKTETINIAEYSGGEVSGPRTGKTKEVAWFSTAISKVAHQPGLSRARALLRESTADTLKMVVVIGDVPGWLEDDPNEQVVLDEIVAGAEEGICWSFIFTGDDAAANPQLEEARAGFRRMAAAAGERGSFAQGNSPLLPAEIFGQFLKLRPK